MSAAPKELTPRQELAEAIAAAAEAKAAVDKNRGALDSIQARLSDAKAALEKARSGLDRAKAKSAREGNAATAIAAAMKAAREKQAECEDMVDAYQGGIAQAEEELADAERRLRIATDLVNTRRADVARLQIPNLLAKAQRTQTKLIGERAAVRALVDIATSMKTTDRFTAEEASATSFLRHASMPMAIGFDASEFKNHEAAIAVRGFFEALKADANATLKE